MINPTTGAFVTEFGPLACAEVVLLDEINRIPLKSQSAFLEGLQERRVTVGKNTYELPAFSFAIATDEPTRSAAGGGQYFEIGREADRDVASRLIASLRGRAPASPREESQEEIYWRFLFAASVVFWIGPFLLYLTLLSTIRYRTPVSSLTLPRK